MIHFRLIVEKKALSRPSSESQMDLFLFGILWGQVRKANGDVNERRETFVKQKGTSSVGFQIKSPAFPSF